MSVLPIKINEIKIKSDHVDFTRKLKVSKLLEFFQDAASDHAEEMGLGFDELNARNLMWVLVKVKIEINKMPSVNDNITLKTWPLKAKIAFFEREFQLFNENNEEILKATTIWCILDKDTRNIVKSNEVPCKITEYCTERVIFDKLSKVSFSENILNNYILDKTIRYSDMDQNVHFNNTKFADIIMDCFSIDFLKENSLKSIYINFANEGKYADNIKAYLENDGKNYKALGVNATKNNNLFEAELVFE